MVTLGLIGCGYWGPNLIRNFTKVRECRIEAVADQRPERLEAVRHLNPAMRLTGSAEELIESEARGRRIALELSDLTLVDRDAVRFLEHCEAQSIELENCPAYIREWIAREREGK